MKRLHSFDILLNWYGEHITINGYRPRTIKSYLHELSLFHRWLTEHSKVNETDDISKTEITEFIASLYKKGLASTTIAHKVAVLKSFLTTIHQENKMYRDLSQVIQIPRQPRKIPKGFLSEREVDFLLDYL